MPWAHKGGERLTQWGDQILFECDSFIARKHGVAHTNLAVAIADRCRHVGYFIAARLPLTHCAAETLERFEEERLDVVRLEATRLSALHLLAYTGHAAGVHGVMGQRPLLDQPFEVLPVHSVLYCACEPCTDFRLIPISDGLDQKLAQRLTFKFKFA